MMILRKPYAILIRFFRLIHMIITGLLIYLVIQNMNIYKYLNSVIEDSALRYNAYTFINYKIYIYIIISVFLCGIIYWLLKYKNKPRRIYMFTIVGYLIVGIFMLVLYNYMNSFNLSIIDQKTIRLYRDSLLISLFFQYYIILFMLIRSFGFDIKKFNFKKDAEELNLTGSDSEEIVVNTNIDTTGIKRVFRKHKRELGYFFQEFKIIIIMGSIIILGSVGYFTYKYFNNKYKYYNENEYVGIVNKVSVINSYYSNINGKNYIIVSFNVYKSGEARKLNMANFSLTVNGKSYSADRNTCHIFNYLGNCYKQQYIDSDAKNYIFVYEVDSVNTEDAYLYYNETYDNIYKIKLSLKSN